MDETLISTINLKNIGLTQKEEPSLDSLAAVGSELVKAFKDTGFVYVTGHGVPEDVIRKAFESSGDFFSKTDEQKRSGTRCNNMGYLGIDDEKLSSDSERHELRECYDVNNLDGDYPDALVPALRPAVRELVEDFTALTYRILRALESGLGVPKDTLVKLHPNIFSGNGVNPSCIRMLNYPPVPPNVPKGTIRCGEHSDYGTITFLMQDANGGLEVRERSGKWVFTSSIPGAILINVGQTFEMWTKIVATEHRVMIPEKEQIQRLPRRSMAFFVHPDDDVVILPFDGSPATPITSKQFLIKKLTECFRT